MVITSPLLDLIMEVHFEGLKEVNWKKENIRFHIPLFVRDTRGLLTWCDMFPVPSSGGLGRPCSKKHTIQSFRSTQVP